MRTSLVSSLAIAGCLVALAVPSLASRADAAPSRWCAGAVSWTVATKRIGKRVLVKGRVARAFYDRRAPGRPTLLDLGNAYPHPSRLTIVIPGRSRANFPARPEGMFRKGRTICVRGVVRFDHAISEIEVHRWDAARRRLT